MTKTKGTSRASKPRKSATATGKPATRLIDQRIRALGGWRGETLARMRRLILEADPGMTDVGDVWRGRPRSHCLKERGPDVIVPVPDGPAAVGETPPS